MEDLDAGMITGNLLPPTLTLCVDSGGRCSPIAGCAPLGLSPGNSFGANRGWLWKHPRTTVITIPSWAPQWAQTQDFLQTGPVIQVFNAADVYTVKHIFTNKQPDNEGWESWAHKWRPHSSLMRLKYTLIYREYKRKNILPDWQWKKRGNQYNEETASTDLFYIQRLMEGSLNIYWILADYPIEFSNKPPEGLLL